MAIAFLPSEGAFHAPGGLEESCHPWGGVDLEVASGSVRSSLGRPASLPKRAGPPVRFFALDAVPRIGPLDDADAERASRPEVMTFC